MNVTFSSHRKPVALVGALASLAALSLAFTGSANATGSEHHAGASKPKPTVVLVHGAFADASSWNGVVTKLQHDGYPVIAPANPLRGVASDATYLESILKSIKGPLILAGHSYGGSVISEAAVDNPQVKALVYIAAFLPDKGESASELSSKFPGSTLGETLNPVPFPLPDGSTGTDLYIQQDKFHHQFAADLPAGTAAVLAATQRPVAASGLDEKATEAAWKTIPSWDLIDTQDLNIPPAAQRFMAQRAHAHTVEVKASHLVPVSQPGAVTHIIEQAAHSTTR
jgi:pimeloyl-ACP methyl ester carboxylesterase